MSITERSLAPPSLHSPFRYLHTFVTTAEPSLLQAEQPQLSASSRFLLHIITLGSADDKGTRTIHEACLLPNLSLRTRLLAQPWQQRPPPLNHLFWRHSGGGCPLLCPAGPLAPALAPARPPTSAFPRGTGRRGARPQRGHTPAPQRPLLSPATRGAAASATEEKAAAAERRERLPSPHLAASRSPTAVPARSDSGAA